MEIPILFQDSDLLVCVKPAGVSSEEGGLPDLLRAQCGGGILCVHRLDKPVGGVIVYARNPNAAASLSRAIAERKMAKEYLAVVQGCPGEASGELRDLLYHDAKRNKSYVVQRPRRGVKEAVLRYSVLSSAEEAGQAFSLLKIRLLTGRSHQIRVQFASRGLPLLGDGRYGSRMRDCALALWSGQLQLEHPSGGEKMTFCCRPPEVQPWTAFSDCIP